MGSSQTPGRIILVSAVLSVLFSGGLLFSLFGHGAAALDSEEHAVPEHEVLYTFDGAGVREIGVATSATRESQMRLVARELKDSTPDNGTLLIEYYRAPDRSENTGFALVFDNRRAVLDAGRTERFGKVYNGEDAERIIEEEGGIRVVGFERYAEENPSVWRRIERFLR